MNQELVSFTQGVIEELSFYVYRLIDPRNGETFYVGKGYGNRVFAHVNDEEGDFISSYLKEEIEGDEVIDNISQKFKRIREIRSAGEKVIHIIHRHGLTSKDAFLVEATLIDAFPGLTNKQGGVSSSDYGPMSVQQIQTLYRKEEAVFDDKIILIAINRWKSNFSESQLYDLSRFAWRLSKVKSSRAQFVVAHSSGIVREVYEPKEWLPATYNNFGLISHMGDIGKGLEDYPDDRLAFNGSLASEDIRKKYNGKRVPSEYRKKGAANPIKYTFK